MKNKLIKNILSAFLMTIICATVSLAQTKSLKGNWVLTGLKQNGNPVDINVKGRGGEKLGINFTDAQRFGLISTCNAMGGSYTARANGSFKPGAILSTKMFCGDEDLMKVEIALSSAMQAVTKYHIKNNRLILRDRSGKNLLTFSRAK
jgi:heat shock protein HslJ